MKNFVLFLIAITLCILLFPLGAILTLYKAIQYRKSTPFIQYFSRIWRETALSLDRLGNTVCADLLDAMFIGAGGYHFGHSKETVSSALGKNQLRGTLTWAGKALVWVLDAIDKDHCFNAIDEAI